MKRRIFFTCILLLLIPSPALPDLPLPGYREYRVKTLINRGDHLLKGGALHEALRLFSMAESLSPADPVVMHKKGVVLLYLNRLDQAEVLFRKGLEHDGDQPYIHHNLGLIMKRKGLYKRAIHHFEKVTLLEPDGWEGYYNLLCVQALGGETEAALESLEEAMERGFNKPDLLINDPDLKSLAGRDDFERIVSKMRSGGR